MTLWRYRAVSKPSVGSRTATITSGELSGDTAAEVRASLRRIGLQVIDLRPVRSNQVGAPFAHRLPSVLSIVSDPVRQTWRRQQRSRRRISRAEFYDGMATMLDSGLPLPEAVDTLIGESTRSRLSRSLPLDPRRRMLLEIREQLRGGHALDEACAHHPGWFDPAELAMIRAGQHNGDLPGVMRNLSERHQRSNELGHKITGALAYPAVIATVGIGVVVFLSVKTLPDLVAILDQADVAIPALTMRVMAIGQFMFQFWWLLLVAASCLLACAALCPAMCHRWAGRKAPALQGRSSGERRTWTVLPRVVRRIGVASVSLRLAELIRTGVPIVEALRVLAPTAQMPGLTRLLGQAADEIERGEDLAEAFNDPAWFDMEYRRLLAIGQSTGELPDLLERIGRRYQRQAERVTDRLAALLEPVVLLGLAFLIGIVVMAAVLPLIRLQEVFG